jgi:hypothetical protein
VFVVFRLAPLEIWRAAIDPNHYRTIAFTLFFFGIVVSFFTDVLPSIKSFHQFVMHCSPLVASYLIGSMWRANDTPRA